MAIPLLAYLGIPVGIAVAHGLKDWFIEAPTKIGLYGAIPRILGAEQTFFEMKGVPPFSWAYAAGQETRQGAIDIMTGLAAAPAKAVKAVTDPITKGVSDVTGSVTKGLEEITGAFTSPVKGLTQTITEFKLPDITIPSMPTQASQIILIPQQAAQTVSQIDDKTIMYGAIAVGIALIVAGVAK